MDKKWLLGVVVVVCLCGVTAMALDQLGPPTAGLKQGQWSAGFNYSYSSQDLDKTKMKWSEVWDGESDSGSYKLKIKDWKTQRYYGRIGYGVDDWWEVYAQLGVADVKSKFKEVGDDEWSGVNFDNDFAWGLGTKVTFARQDKIDWGVAFQMNWLNTSRSEKGTDEEDGDSESWKETIDIETYDLLLAVGPTVDMGGWKLYGGPFYYYLSGDIKIKETGTWTGEEDSGSWLYKEKGDLEAASNFGGYIGAQLDLTQNCNATVEFASTGDGWGLGTGIVWKF